MSSKQGQSCPNLPQIPTPGWFPFQNHPIKSPTCPQLVASCPFMGKGGGKRKAKDVLYGHKPTLLSLGAAAGQGWWLWQIFVPWLLYRGFATLSACARTLRAAVTVPKALSSNQLPPQCTNRGDHPALAWEEPVPSVPSTAGQCPHGKAVPGGLSPLSPHHFHTRASCHRGVGGSGSNSWEALESQARAQLTEELFGKQSLSFHQPQKQGNVSRGTGGRGICSPVPLRE